MNDQLAVPNPRGKQWPAVCPNKIFPLGMAVKRSLLSPSSRLLAPEKSQIDEDHGIAEFRQLPRLGETVGHLIAMLV